MAREYSLSQYGCVRYRDRPWARLLADLASTAFDDDGNMSADFMRRINDDVLRPLLDSATALQQPADWPAFQANAMREVATAGLHTAWLRFGRQIFHLTPALVREFRYTDVDATSFEGLALPYRAFFVHFGIQEDIILDDNSREQPEFVDGAYVFHDAEGGITFELTLSRPQGASSLLPGAQLSITRDLQTISASQAVRIAVERAIAKASPPTGDATSALTSATSAEAAAFLERASGPLIAATNLLANALFYLSEYPDDRIAEAEAAAPESSRDRYIISTGTRKHKIAQTLFSEGFSIVNFVGRSLEHPDASGQGAELISAHWRRGHWRNQKFGPHLSLVKRIRIRPVLVRADLGGPGFGRIYETPKRDA